MNEELPDDRFKSEVMRLLNTVIVKLEEHDQRFEGIEKKLDQNTDEIIAVKNNVKILSAQFTDVVGMVLEDNKRITKLEKDVKDLQGNIH